MADSKVDYPFDEYGNCKECGGGYEGSIPHTPECKYNISKDESVYVQISELRRLDLQIEKLEADLQREREARRICDLALKNAVDEVINLHQEIAGLKNLERKK